MAKIKLTKSVVDSAEPEAHDVELRDTLVPGVDVMTLSGQLGTIVEAEGDVITIETTPGVHTRWLRAAIGPVPASVAAAAVEDEDDSLEGEIAETPEYGVREMREDDPGQAPRH